MGITRGLYVTVSPHRLERMKSDIFFAHRLKEIVKDKIISACFDTLICLRSFLFAKCQNEKCRQGTQNRVSDGAFLCVFSCEKHSRNVIRHLLHCNSIAFTS